MEKISLIEHSDNCRTATRRQKCHLCKNKYHSDYRRKKRSEVKKKNALKIKTCSDSFKIASKYEHIFCQDCKDKNYSKKDIHVN